MRFILLVSAIAIAVSACQGIPTTELTVADGQKTLQVPKEIRWKRDSMFGSSRIEWLLVSGEYRESFTDDAGVYYIGHSPCFFSTIVTDAGPKSGISFACGIYRPNNATAEPKVFLIEGTAREQKRFAPDGTPILDSSGQGAAVASIYSMLPGGIVGAGISKNIQGRFIDPVQQPPSGWLTK